MAYVLALDQGTTSSRAIIFDRGGCLVAAAQQEFEQLFPRPGWVEHDPEEIWASQLQVADEAVRRAGIDRADIAAIGITNQRETTIVWDRATGVPVCNAIVWQDRRTADAIEKLKKDGHEPLIRSRTGLVPDAYFSATKLAWILDNIDEARQRAEDGGLAFGTVDCWLVHQLTDGELHVTDASNASRTMLYDIHSGRWDEELLELFRIPAAVLPKVCASSEVVGDAVVDSTFRGTPIAGIAGDQQAALAGQLCTEAGSAKCTYGTGCFLLQNTGADAVLSTQNMLTTVAWQNADGLTYALEGSVFIGGAVVQWLRDGLGFIESAPEIKGLAALVPDSGGVYLVPAFTGLGAPHWDGFARGTMCGITRGTTKAHIARAALDAIAYQVADVADAMAAATGLNVPELRVDGGAADNDLLMQLQADALQTPVVRPSVIETTALGAAYLAGLAVGYWKDTHDLTGNWRADRRFEPQTDPESVAEKRERWTEAVRRSLRWEPSVE